MRLHIIGSSSMGNAYYLEGEHQSLLIEAGVPFKWVKQSLKFRTDNVVGCLLSHSHNDHAKYTTEIAKNGINIYGSLESLNNCGVIDAVQHRSKIVVPTRKYKIGEFTVLPFELVHDTKVYGYLIHHKEMGLTSFITDTYYCPFVFPGLNNVIIEANYSNSVIDDNVLCGNINPKLAARIKQTHMSDDRALHFIKNNNLKEIRNIILIHMSKINIINADVKLKFEQQLGISPTLAKRNIIVNLSEF